MRTHAPRVPDLEEAPSQWDFVKDFGLGFASSAVGLWAGGLQAGDKLFKFKNALTGVSTGLNQLNTGNQQAINPWISQSLTSGISNTTDSSTSSSTKTKTTTPFLTQGTNFTDPLSDLIGLAFTGFGGNFNNLLSPGGAATFNYVSSYLGEWSQIQSGINIDPFLGFNNNRNSLNTFYRYPSTNMYKLNPEIWRGTY